MFAQCCTFVCTYIWLKYANCLLYVCSMFALCCTNVCTMFENILSCSPMTLKIWPQNFIDNQHISYCKSQFVRFLYVYILSIIRIQTVLQSFFIRVALLRINCSMKDRKGEGVFGSLKQVFSVRFLFVNWYKFDSFLAVSYFWIILPYWNSLASGCKIISFSCVFLFAGLFWHIINSII